MTLHLSQESIDKCLPSIKSYADYQIRFLIGYQRLSGGEANYSWVERKTIKVSPDISDSALIRLAKKEMGLAGRHKTSDFGCDLRIDFPGTVLFITAKD